MLLKRLYPPRVRVLSDPISQALFAFGRPRVSRLFDAAVFASNVRAKEDDLIPYRLSALAALLSNARLVETFHPDAGRLVERTDV